MSVLLRDFNRADHNEYRKAERIYASVYGGRECSQSERVALINAIREKFLDDENFKRAFNLRIARRFDTEELNAYEESCKKGYRKFYDTTVYSDNGTFYFGMNYG